MRIRKSPHGATAFQAFYLTSNFAATQSPVWVGVIGATAYLPGVIVSLLFHSLADAPGAELRLATSSSLLVAGAIVLVLTEILSPSRPIYLTIFVISQLSLSIVKAFNKGYAGRIIRINFPGFDGSKILQRLPN